MAKFSNKSILFLLSLISIHTCHTRALQTTSCWQHVRHSIESVILCLPAAGGVHNGEYVSWLYCYDPIMDVWARKQDMNTKRAIHALAGMNDRLYAIGGNHLKGKYRKEVKINVFFQRCVKEMMLLGAGDNDLCYTV